MFAPLQWGTPKPFSQKGFFVAQWGECEHGPPMPEGARPVFADGKDRSSRGLSLWGPFIFGRKESGVNKILVVS